MNRTNRKNPRSNIPFNGLSICYSNEPTYLPLTVWPDLAKEGQNWKFNVDIWSHCCLLLQKSFFMNLESRPDLTLNFVHIKPQWPGLEEHCTPFKMCWSSLAFQMISCSFFIAFFSSKIKPSKFLIESWTWSGKYLQLGT